MLEDTNSLDGAQMCMTKAQISLRICGLISAFVVCCLDNIISLVSFFATFMTLAGLCSWAGQFESTLAENPEDRLYFDEAHFMLNRGIPMSMH